MKGFKYLSLTAVAGVCFILMAPRADAQINIEIGAAPDCPYGYYDVPPYSCAPYGYYGPEWFPGGVFIGAGKWFHGPANFHGHVNNAFDAQHGYKGPVPNRGEKREPARRPEQTADFKGNELRDGRGHAGEEKR
jgi:hypothetical protein